MLAFIQGPTGGAEAVHRPTDYLSETAMLPEAVIVFDGQDVVINCLIKSAFLKSLVGSLPKSANLDYVYSKLHLLPEHILFLTKQGYYMGGYDGCSLEYKLNTNSHKNADPEGHSGGVLLISAPLGERPDSPNKTNSSTTEVIEQVVSGNMMQRPLSHLSQLIGNSFVLNTGPAELHGHFVWFDKVKDTTVIACGYCKGGKTSASQMAAHVMALLHLVVVEQGYSEGDEIMNRLSYYLYKFTRDKIQIVGSILEISIAVINRKQRWVELSGSQVGCMCLQQGTVSWLKGSRAMVGDPKILLSKQDYRSTRHRLDDLESIYLYTSPLIDQLNEKANRPLTRARLANLLESVAGMPMADQATLLQEHLNVWRGTNPINDHQLIIGFRVD